jgi:hypothetical protein
MIHPGGVNVNWWKLSRFLSIRAIRGKSFVNAKVFFKKRA